MLGKLFKHEFKSTAKVMLTIYGVLILTTILGILGFSTQTMLTDYEPLPLVINLLFISTVILYILSIFTLFIVTYVYVCLHFYKTMYSDQGYLTHTLPVKPSTLFHVKLTTAWVWMMGTMILFFLSIFLLLISITRGELFTQLMFDTDFQYEFLNIVGMTIGQFSVTFFVQLAFSCLSYLLTIFASISIGQLFTSHKIVGAIVSGIAIYFIEQIIGSTILLLTASSFTKYLFQTLTIADMFKSPSYIISSVVSILFTISFYIICIVIQKRHLNLD